jgi:hypothetical protein
MTPNNTSEKTEYFFFLAECKGNNSPASFIGEPIPVTRAVAQLFMNAATNTNSTLPPFRPQHEEPQPFNQREFLPKKDCSDQHSAFSPSTAPPAGPATTTSPKSKNSIGTLMEALFKRPSTGSAPGDLEASDASIAGADKNAEPRKSQRSLASDTLKTFLPFKPSEHKSIFGAPYTVPSLEDDRMEDENGNGSEHEDDSVSDFESADENTEDYVDAETREGRKNTLMGLGSRKVTGDKGANGKNERPAKILKACELRNYRHSSRLKTGSNKAYLNNLSSIFSSSRQRQRQKRKR